MIGHANLDYTRTVRAHVPESQRSVLQPTGNTARVARARQRHSHGRVWPRPRGPWCGQFVEVQDYSIVTVFSILGGGLDAVRGGSPSGCSNFGCCFTVGCLCAWLCMPYRLVECWCYYQTWESFRSQDHETDLTWPWRDLRSTWNRLIINEVTRPDLTEI